MLDNVTDLIFQIRHRCVSEETILMDIAECAAHRASLLSADCSNPLVTQINFVVGNSVNFFGQAKKICLDVIFFAVVAYGEKFQATHGIEVDLAGVSQDHFGI